MIITERFVFIHMHKTGGQTLNDVISDCIRDHQVLGYHFPRRMVPQEFSNLPVVGLVRNPWSWYVSWYFFNRRPNIRNSLFTIVSEGLSQGGLRQAVSLVLSQVSAISMGIFGDQGLTVKPNNSIYSYYSSSGLPPIPENSTGDVVTTRQLI